MSASSDHLSANSFPELAAALCNVCQLFGERQWCLATSGNFSVRVDADRCLITQSGKDKSILTPDDLMICDMRGRPLDQALMPSAETALHTCLYRHDLSIGAVLHTHSVTATVSSRHADDDILLNGFEMQKALPHINAHDTKIAMPVFDNSQNMDDLTGALLARLGTGADPVPAFLIRGHGLYAWGADLSEAQRHIEGVEFLLACHWQETLAGRR